MAVFAAGSLMRGTLSIQLDVAQTSASASASASLSSSASLLYAGVGRSLDWGVTVFAPI